MSSPWKEDAPEVVADRVLKRVEVSKIARKLQNRLALAQFKTSRGWEDFTLDKIELKVEEELKGRRRPRSSGDVFSDSSSSTSEFPYPASRTLMSSPLKGSLFSDQVGSGSSSGGHRKRTHHNSFEHASSSSSSRKRYRSSPSSRVPASSHTSHTSHASWKDSHQLSQSSPIKPRKHPNFTTSSGPNLSFFQRSSDTIREDNHANYAAASEDEDDLPAHSFNVRSATPRTPPPVHSRGNIGRRVKDRNGKSGEEGADLLLYLATSPSPANPSNRARMQPPSTPPPKNKDMNLPSSMMTTPGGGGLLSVFGGPHTPSQAFDFADFVNITPSPGQRAWPKTPRTIKTPLTVNRKSLNFDSFMAPSASPGRRDHISSTAKHSGLGMHLEGDT